MRSGDLIVADQFAHASVVDGMILSKAKSRFFRHNRVDDLEKKLKGFDGRFGPGLPECIKDFETTWCLNLVKYRRFFLPPFSAG